MTMKVVNFDVYKGKLFRCDCGEVIWELLGKAKRHKESCPSAK